MKIIILTNNGLLTTAQLAGEVDCEIEFRDQDDVLAVLTRVRDAVHKGHKLLTHPLSGSVKPYESPYKSVAISAECRDLDLNSLTTIENTIAMAEVFKRHNEGKRQLTEKILDDFKLIDLQLMANSIVNIKQEDLWQKSTM